MNTQIRAADYQAALISVTSVINSKVIEVRDESQIARLPMEILALVIPPAPGKGEVLFFNGGDEIVAFSWRSRRWASPRCAKTEATSWTQVRLAPNESQRFSIG